MDDTQFSKSIEKELDDHFLGIIVIRTNFVTVEWPEMQDNRKVHPISFSQSWLVARKILLWKNWCVPSKYPSIPTKMVTLWKLTIRREWGEDLLGVPALNKDELQSKSVRNFPILTQAPWTEFSGVEGEEEAGSTGKSASLQRRSRSLERWWVKNGRSQLTYTLRRCL